MSPSPGVGGHCIAVDPWFLVDADPINSKIIQMGRKINDMKSSWTANKVSNLIDQRVSVSGKDRSEMTIALFGLAFKPNIDDLRESPALKVLKKLSGIFAGRILVVEPNITTLPGGINDCELVDPTSAIELADIKVILVGHNEFKNIPFPLQKTYFTVPI